MPLFQKTIVNKFLKNQSKELVSQHWEVYKNHFLNPAIQQNIKASKEEEYQEGFLDDLFVKVLGYTKKPQPDFNLESEKKNVTDSKKADGAIIINEQTLAVIELKSTQTIDLSKIEYQAFGYKNSHKNCSYVIVSNFEKLRFFIDDKTEFIEFNLFQLSESEFEIMYLCLAFENIKNHVPKQIKEQSITQEKDITERLYKDYTNFRNAVFQNLQDQNPQYDALLLFKKTQKLLDRFLFIFFAEDRYLLPTNSIRSINQHWKQISGWNEYRPLYNQYKTYFGFLQNGLQNEIHDIFAFNGGLFDPDEVLDNVLIDDKILLLHSQKISDYDFNSEVDVNILGHIFENSLNEIDEIKAQLEDPEGKNPIDKNQTKRKKDGVFYTPRYITQYIVENTVGKLCNEKRPEFEEELSPSLPKKQKEIYLQQIQDYRDWLLQITIIDPACGSGAFLNEALNFLIEEHEHIDKLQGKIFGDSFMISDIDTSILENNIFGVDLNEESVEIAKLSLWLRTARPKRKLTNLNNNIKCGNSLIDDPAVAGEKAFNWQKEFPHIFAKGGFDVVVGNPPYVRGREFTDLERNYLIKYGISSNDTAILFIKRAKELINKNGLISYIIPKSLLFASNWDAIRNEIYKNIETLIDCGKVWDEVLLEQIIFVLSSIELTEYKTGFRKNNTIKETSKINNNYSNIFNFLPVRENFKSLEVAKRLKTKNKSLNFYYNNIAGVPFQKHISENGTINMIGGAEFNRFEIKNTKGKIDKVWVKSENAFIKENSIIVQNIIAHILYPYEHIKITACVPSFEHINKTSITNTVNQLILNPDFNISNKYTWCILNSKLINWYVYRFVFALAIRTMHFYNPISEKVPFICISKEAQAPFIEKAELMLVLHKELQEASEKFQRTIQRKFELEVLPKKLQEWYLLSYKDFLAELLKKKIKLTLSQEAEWESYFTEEANKTLAIKTKIDLTDKEIDRMVYELYGLSEEEIAVVEQ